MIFPYDRTDLAEHRDTMLGEIEDFTEHFRVWDATTLLQIIHQKCYWRDGRYHFLRYWQCLVLDSLWLQATGFKEPRPREFIDF